MSIVTEVNIALNEPGMIELNLLVKSKVTIYPLPNGFIVNPRLPPPPPRSLSNKPPSPPPYYYSQINVLKRKMPRGGGGLIDDLR